jgi:Zn-dependent protease with chaperone function
MEGTEAPSEGPSLAGRVAAAIALTIGFYLLALVIAGALLAAAILPWVFGGHNNLWVTLTGVIAGITILVAIFPRRLRFETPGVRVTAGDQPALVALIEEESGALGMDPPDELYVNFEVNAAVTQAGRGRRVMIVGLPLLQFLSTRGARGVVAHELGHYAGGDTRLGPWIYRTRETIGRTLHHLSDEHGDDSWTDVAIRKPFEWYATAFLRITATISRRQEYAADRFAVRRAGRDVYVESLRRLHAYAPAFDPYWQDEVVPALQVGRRPPVVGGYATFIHSEPIEQAAREHVERELHEGETDRYDSHPALGDRLGALEGLPAGEPDDSPPAAELITDEPALERDVLAFLFGPDAAELEPIAWDQVAESVYLDRARVLTAEFGYVLTGLTAGGLAEAAADRDRLAGEVQRHDRELGRDDAHSLVLHVLRDGLLVALADNGWTVSAEPAQPVMCRRGEHELAPAAVVAELTERLSTSSAWADRARELGIAELSLEPRGTGEPAPAA